MDNQQERSSTIDLAWLGGIIDADGNVSIHISREKKNKFRLYPRIQVTSGDQEIIEEVARIWKDNKVGVYLDQNASGIRHAMINGLKRCRTALESVKGFLRAKRPQADVMDLFVESRLSHENSRSSYNRRELECFVKARELNSWNRGAQKQDIDDFVDEILRGHMSSPSFDG